MRTRWRGAAALIAVVAAVALAAPGLPLSPATAASTSYKLSYQKLPDGKNTLVRWNPCQVITYRVNASALSTSTYKRNRALMDVKQAFKHASYATGITFKYTGLTSEIPKNTSTQRWHERQRAAEIVVAYVNQSSSKYRTNLLGSTSKGVAAGTGGYAFKYWKVGAEPWQGVTGRGFVILDAKQDSKFRWGFGSGSTRGSLMLHEIGHALGLQHVGTTSQQMYPTVLSRSSTAYSAGDKAGLAKVGKSSGCIGTPSWVWKDMA